jgi:hypothetical protein
MTEPNNDWVSDFHKALEQRKEPKVESAEPPVSLGEPSPPTIPSVADWVKRMVRLNVLVYEDGDLWVAQAIEADIAATADSLTELPRAIERAIVANISVNSKMGRSGLDGIPPAPAAFKDLADWVKRMGGTLTESDFRRIAPTFLDSGPASILRAHITAADWPWRIIQIAHRAGGASK